MDEKLMVKEEQNWLRVDARLRDKCVQHLRENIVLEEQAELAWMFKNNDWPIMFHMTAGMTIRNMLRQVVRDDELPGVEYTHVTVDDGPRTEEGHPIFSNWDDFYMAALRQAVMPKEGEV